MYSEGLDITQWTIAPLQISLTATLDTSTDVAFHALSDPVMMCRVFPWMDSVVVDSSSTGPYGVGAVRTCALDNGLVIEEEIIGWQPPHGYAYRGFDETHPFGMLGHVGVLSFESAANGCELTWQQYFSHANIPAMREQLQQSMQAAMDRLVQRFGGHFEIGKPRKVLEHR